MRSVCILYFGVYIKFDCCLFIQFSFVSLFFIVLCLVLFFRYLFRVSISFHAFEFRNSFFSRLFTCASMCLVFVYSDISRFVVSILNSLFLTRISLMVTRFVCLHIFCVCVFDVCLPNSVYSAQICARKHGTKMVAMTNVPRISFREEKKSKKSE